MTSIIVAYCTLMNCIGELNRILKTNNEQRTTTQNNNNKQSFSIYSTMHRIHAVPFE